MLRIMSEILHKDIRESGGTNQEAVQLEIATFRNSAMRHIASR
jgi:hypothetical protein